MILQSKVKAGGALEKIVYSVRFARFCVVSRSLQIGHIFFAVDFQLLI